MTDRVFRTIERYGMVPAGARIGIAVSGGADSLCLLHLLAELAPKWDARLCVLHVDHGLRGAESAADAEFVRAQAEQLGLPFHLDRPQLRGGNLEQAAREARLQFFSRCREAGIAHRIATGHTRSDQAETVLFRFLRGAGTTGLSGIRPVTTDGRIRPLIEIDRSETERYLISRGIVWREDSTNRSLEFDRNRIRHQLLPDLAREWNPALASTLAHTAEWAQGEERFWEQRISALAVRLLRERDGALLIDIRDLAQLTLAESRRLLRFAIQRVKGDLRGIEFQHVAALLNLAEAGEGHGRTQAPGIDAMRSFEWLRLAVPGSLPDRDYRIPLPVPGSVPLPPAGRPLSTEIIEKPETIGDGNYVYNMDKGCVDLSSLAGPLLVRNWKPGDQYQPLGHNTELKIKSLFQNARIPLWERRHWPVVLCGEQIVWVREFGVAADYAAGSGAAKLLRIREHAGIGSGSDGV